MHLTGINILATCNNYVKIQNPDFGVMVARETNLNPLLSYIIG